MTAVAALLSDPHVARLVTRLPPDGVDARAVTEVQVAEDVAAIARVGAGAMVVLTARASAALSGYRLDLAVRLAADRRAAALVLLSGEETVVGTSAQAIAGAGRVTVLRADPAVPTAELVVAVDRRLNDGAAAALHRVHRGLTRLDTLRAEDAPIEALLEAAGECLGEPVELRPPRAAELGVPVRVEGRTEGTLSTARPADRFGELAAELVLALASAAVAEGLQRTRRAEEAPDQRRAELLTELLLAEPPQAGGLLDRARALGIDIDGWHTAVLLETDEAPDHAGSDSSRFDRALAVRRAALEVARDAGGVWHRARSGGTLLVVRIDPDDPGLGAISRAGTVATGIVSRVAEVGATTRAGVGSSHPGLAGLRRSVAEARAALSGRDAPVVSFDSLGTNRFLAEWSASTVGREIGQTLLAPLERLGPERRATAVRTLAAYLDHHGSLLHAAEALHLHRNSLAYRLKRILAVLDVDLDDPNQWMMLQLACRARLLQETTRNRP
ncbi:helix-turn-helix domain-containing protein [Pseudonocardia kunmingensis]|uniref:Sugar diacid utilization regulator n=1 Tax=Pseudonocardia kunmingensis TaxID=630975 RepID=A0A543DQM6_9PSEU|nr:helix-turn-helix domain-containing protein [Pseudonocardia kunmingensis]TQM11613.1 sugar diacid utilization regulator [Pseudonocardia kunmingensis]